MKHIWKRLGIATLIVAMLASLVCLGACGDTPPEEPAFDVSIFVDGENPDGYVIVYENGNDAAKKLAVDLNNTIRNAVGIRLTMVSDIQSPGDYEILVGQTNRPLSSALKSAVDAKDAEDHNWGFKADGTVLALYASTNEGYTRCFKQFGEELVRNRSLTIKSNLMKFGVLTAEAYQAELDEIARREEERKLAEMQVEIEKLLPLLNAFELSDFYGTDQRYSWAKVKKTVAAEGNYDSLINYNVTSVVDMTAAMTAAKYNMPTQTPTVGQHPRLLFTAEDIPSIKASLSNPENAAALQRLMEYVEADVDGILVPITYEDPSATKASGKRNNSNMNYAVLSALQAKALYYAITGYDLYGYQALYGIKNYLTTLDIGFYDSDQCRYFGYTAYMAACVYDWCYDLMTEADKEQIALGIQNACFVGFSSLPDGGTHNGVKSELGFPPTSGTGPVEGHGAELALLRDFLSVAIAIYDEYPSWYNCIGGRMFDQYIPIRNYFYESSGMYPEGTSVYAPYRFVGDLYSAWMMESALGENPYSDDMQLVTISMVTHEGWDGRMFSTGDGNQEWMKTISIGTCALMSSYLYNDSAMRAYATWDGTIASGGEYGVCNLSTAEVILCSMKGTATAEDRHADLPLILYNGGYYQQIIARTAWAEDAPVVLMRGASAMTYGHAHQASGEFQIYYKGMLAGDDGVYDNYGSDHHYYYHKATISHSCVLVYNPDKKGTDGGYYSGGQPKVSGPADVNNYQAFIDGDIYSTGKVLGVKYGYDENNVPKYVYFANDLTKGYSVNVVNYVGRTMLTTFTGDADYPMVLFVYDRIDVPDTDYTKTFLLQSVAKPVIDTTNMTASVSNGSGKMVLKSFVEGGSIAAYGGYAGTEDYENFSKYRYYISTQGKNLMSKGGLSSGANGAGVGGNTNGAMWGKIEVRAPQGNKSDTMLNVVYVTDADNNTMLNIQKISGDGFTGAQAAGQVAIFATETGHDLRTSRLTFSSTGTGTQSYYVGGLKEGRWMVRIGNEQQLMTVAAGEQMLYFTGAAGEVTLIPVQ